MAEGSGSATTAERPEKAEKLSTADAIDAARSVAGVSPHIVAGALSGVNRENHTENQIKQAVKDFTKRPEDQDGNWDRPDEDEEDEGGSA